MGGFEPTTFRSESDNTKNLMVVGSYIVVQNSRRNQAVNAVDSVLHRYQKWPKQQVKTMNGSRKCATTIIEMAETGNKPLSIVVGSVRRQ